jgi:manganese/zinc/iron transport system permease protein
MNRRLLGIVVMALGFVLIGNAPVAAQHDHNHAQSGQQTDRKQAPDEAQKPSFSKRLIRVITLQDHNTRVPLFGTLLLGMCSGIVGTFMLLRRQALIGDVVSHAALPGVAGAFLVGEYLSPGEGKSLHALLVGAAIAGSLAVLCTGVIRRFSKIKPDAALATVLGVFFGLGAVLFKIAQKTSGSRAGLDHFILGSAATMTTSDVKVIATTSVVVVVFALVLFKEFLILCFDEEFATANGWPTTWLDFAIMGLVVAVTVVGLQAVGVLMVALLITPAAAARFWTESLAKMTWIAGLIGALSATLGTIASALFERLAGGPTIVLAGTCFFIISLVFGTERGLLRRWYEHRTIQNRIGTDDLLRAMYEILESRVSLDESLDANILTSSAVDIDALLKKRSWNQRRVQSLISRGERTGTIRIDPNSGWRLTANGAREARRAVRNHRLWEMYLITWADIAPSHVDRDADYIEHVLESEVIEQLETLVQRDGTSIIPPSPHPVEG